MLYDLCSLKRWENVLMSAILDTLDLVDRSKINENIYLKRFFFCCSTSHQSTSQALLVFHDISERRAFQV